MADITLNLDDKEPVFEEREVEDSKVVFVPFKDFDGRINQTDYTFREGIPTKITKAEANVWLEGKRGYIK